MTTWLIISMWLLILQEENATSIVVEVRTDATPELAEPYILTLTEVRTLSDVISSGSGAATLDPQASTATITIRASNNPHGEVVFDGSSLLHSTQEGQRPGFTIVRQFGTFGKVDFAPSVHLYTAIFPSCTVLIV